jgi:hypothetical protein
VVYDDGHQRGGLVLIPVNRKQSLRYLTGMPPLGHQVADQPQNRDGEVFWSRDGAVIVARSQFSILVFSLLKTAGMCEIVSPPRTNVLVRGISGDQRIVVSNRGWGPDGVESISVWASSGCVKVRDVPAADAAEYRRQHPALAWTSADRECADPNTGCADAKTGQRPARPTEAHGDQLSISSGGKRAAFGNLHSIKGLGTDGSFPVRWDFEVWNLSQETHDPAPVRETRPGGPEFHFHG